ncbi:MAG: hypothetical protein PUN43_05645, partial [Candidatus Liberibacter asiaticus]|nr:hypothetical protein [Candidatus Liberibacter asiaticus]
WLLSISLSKGLSIDFRRVSGSGVYACPPVSVGDCLVFVCGVGRRIKYLSGSTEQGFRFNEITQLAASVWINSRKHWKVKDAQLHAVCFPSLRAC